MLFIGGPLHGQEIDTMERAEAGLEPTTWVDMSQGIAVLYRQCPVRVPRADKTVWERTIMLSPDVPPKGPEFFHQALLDGIGIWWMTQPPGHLVEDPEATPHVLPESPGQVVAQEATHEAGCVTEGQRFVGTMKDRAIWLREHIERGCKTWVDRPPIMDAATDAAETESTHAEE